MSEIKVDTVAEKTSANGVTVDGLNIKDSKLVTANSVITSNITDANITTAKILDDNVTYAKIQNVSATDRILGRDSSGAGVIEEITPANLRTMLNVADGANVGGGKVIQYKHDYDSASIGLSNTSWTDTNLSIAFTPTSASNRIVIKGFVQCYIDGASNSHGSMQYKVLNGSSDVMEANTNLTGYGGNEAFFNGNLPFNVYETTAGNTNARTYKVQVRNTDANSGASYNQYAGYSVLEIWEIDY